MENDFSTIEEKYRDLIVKVLSDKATSEETNLLKDWISQSPQRKACFIGIKNAWQLSASVQPRNFNADAAWQMALSRVKIGKSEKVFRLKYVSVAAIWILAFLLGGSLTYLIYRNTIQTSARLQYSMNEVNAPKGSKSELMLPDGTKVWLNAGSKLRYSQSYNTNNRDVFLEGEAYFKVKTNPQKPFIVKTSDVSVKAYGTAFNVKAYPEEGTITTTLEEGHIKIAGTDQNMKKFEVSLRPNQKLTYTKKTFAVNIASKKDSGNISATQTPKTNINVRIPVKIDNISQTKLYTSWKDKNWYIEREDMDKLVVVLERRYNVVFNCQSEELKKYKVSGTIRNETLEQVLDFLKLTVPLKYTIREGIVTIDIDRNRSENYLKIMN